MREFLHECAINCRFMQESDNYVNNDGHDDDDDDDDDDDIGWRR